MALAMVPFAAANTAALSLEEFTDANTISDQHREALDVLTALEVIVGVPNGDGTFRLSLERDITRAEAAAIVARILIGPAAANNLSHNTSRFSDVLGTGAYWANGYIEYLAELGIVAGVGGDRFNPQRNVTGIEMARMLLSAVGYGQNNEFVGDGWDLRVLQWAIAHDIEILSRVGNIDFHAPATREQVAQYTFNALVIPHTVSWNSLLGIYSVSTGVGQLERWNPSLGFRTFGLYPVGLRSPLGYPTRSWRLTTARQTNITEVYDNYTVIDSVTDHRGLTGPGAVVTSAVLGNLEVRYNGRLMDWNVIPGIIPGIGETLVPTVDRAAAIARSNNRGVIVETLDSYVILQQAGIGGALGGGAAAQDLGIIRRGDGLADVAVVIDKMVGRLTADPIVMANGQINLPGLFNYNGPAPLQGTQTFPANTVLPEGLRAGDVVLYVQGNNNQWFMELAESVTGNFTQWTPTAVAPNAPGTIVVGGNSYLGTGLRRGLELQGAPAITWPTADTSNAPIVLIDPMWQFVSYAQNNIGAGGEVTVWLDNNGSVIMFSVGTLPTPDYLLLLDVRAVAGTGMTATVLPADGSSRIPRDVNLANWAAVANSMTGAALGAPITRDAALAIINAELGFTLGAATNWDNGGGTPRLMAFTGTVTVGGTVNLTFPVQTYYPAPNVNVPNRSTSRNDFANLTTLRTRNVAQFLGNGTDTTWTNPVSNLEAFTQYGTTLNPVTRPITRDPGNTVYIVQSLTTVAGVTAWTFRQTMATPIFDADDIDYADVVAFTQRPAGMTLAQAAFFRGDAEAAPGQLMMFVGIQDGDGRVTFLNYNAELGDNLHLIAWIDTAVAARPTPAATADRHLITETALDELRALVPGGTFQVTEMMAEVTIETLADGTPVITAVSAVPNLTWQEAIIVPYGTMTVGAAIAPLGTLASDAVVYNIGTPGAVGFARHDVHPAITTNAGGQTVAPGWLIFVERNTSNEIQYVYVRRDPVPTVVTVTGTAAGTAGTAGTTAALSVTTNWANVNSITLGAAPTGVTLTNVNLAAGTFQIAWPAALAAGTYSVVVHVNGVPVTVTLTLTAALIPTADLTGLADFTDWAAVAPQTTGSAAPVTIANGTYFTVGNVQWDATIDAAGDFTGPGNSVVTVTLTPATGYVFDTADPTLVPATLETALAGIFTSGTPTVGLPTVTAAAITFTLDYAIA